MTFNHSPSDRVQVRRLGELMHPGACALCGNGSNEKGYVDLGIYYEYEGQVYLCIDPCAYQVINMLDCLLPDESAHLKSLNDEMANKVKDLETRNADLNARLNAWDTIISNAVAGHPTGDSPSTEPEHKPEPATGTPSEPAEGESEPKESGTEPGPDDSTQSELRNRDFVL